MFDECSEAKEEKESCFEESSLEERSKTQAS